MTDKPHKGRIEQWEKVKYPAAEGEPERTLVWGTFDGHPDFGGYYGHTSYIVSHDEATGEVETRNSRYTLGMPYERD